VTYGSIRLPGTKAKDAIALYINAAAFVASQGICRKQAAAAHRILDLSSMMSPSMSNLPSP
jgi:hypothetical protein